MLQPRVTAHRPLGHPVQIVLVVSTLPLFLGAMVSDWAYASSRQIQWINFASWLIAGALVLAGCALAWAIIDAVRADAPQKRENWIFVALVAATFVAGFVNALIHAKDAWATMPEGMILSVIVLVLALVTIWYGFNRPQTGRPS